MKIAYKDNPLETTVELDEHDKEVFWYKIKIDEMLWKLVGVLYDWKISMIL